MGGLPYPSLWHTTTQTVARVCVLLSEQGYHRLAWTHLIEWRRTCSLFLYRIPPVLGPRPVSSRVSGTTLTGSGDSAPSLIPVLWTSSIWGPYRRRIEVGSSQVVARSLKESSGLQRFSVGWENQRMQWRSLFNKLFDGRSALCSVFSVCVLGNSKRSRGSVAPCAFHSLAGLR